MCLAAQLCPTLCNHMDCKPARLFCPRGFSRQEYWSELPCSPPMDLPNPRIKLRSPTLPTNYLLYEPLQTQQTVFWFISTYVLLSSSLHIKKKFFFFFFFLLLIDFKDFPVCQQSTSSSVYYVLILFTFCCLLVCFWFCLLFSLALKRGSFMVIL